MCMLQLEFPDGNLQHRFLRLQHGGRLLVDDSASVGSLNFHATGSLFVWVKSIIEVKLCLKDRVDGPTIRCTTLHLLDDDPVAVLRPLAQVCLAGLLGCTRDEV
jgi:hypothetical protein